MKTWKVFVFIIKSTFLAFGGGNALFPFMREEAVKKNKWLDDKEFDKLIISTNMIPGPSVVESISYIAIKMLGKVKGTFITLIALMPHIMFALGLFIIAEKFLPKKYLWVINVSIMPVIIGVLLAFSLRFFKLSKKEIGIPLMVALIVFTIGFSLFIPNPWNIPAIVMVVVILAVLIIEVFKQRRKVNK